MEKNKNVGLSVRELLKGMYEGLKNIFPSEEISLSKITQAEIADDSDWHRSRQGYMCYQKVLSVKINDKTWIIGRGERCGSYPADPYDSDLMALEISSNRKSRDEFILEIENAIQQSTYFRNSLIFGTYSGHLGGSKKSPLCQKIFELIQSRISEFIAQKPEVDPEVINLNLTPVYKTVTSYKTEFVNFLVESIKKVLTS